MYRSTRGVPLNYFLDAAGPRPEICSFAPEICSLEPSGVAYGLTAPAPPAPKNIVDSLVEKFGPKA